MNGKAKRKYRSVSMPAELYERISEYRFERRINSMAGAVEGVLNKGLEAIASESRDGGVKFGDQPPPSRPSTAAARQGGASINQGYDGASDDYAGK